MTIRLGASILNSDIWKVAWVMTRTLRCWRSSTGAVGGESGCGCGEKAVSVAEGEDDLSPTATPVMFLSVSFENLSRKRLRELSTRRLSSVGETSHLDR